jgi:DNA-binding LytR/AlgR family response regulator
MTQSEISVSTEAYGIDEFISVRRIDPDRSETSGADGDQPRVLLARSQIVFVRIEGHLLHLHTVTGGEYVRQGTLNGLEQRWASYGLARIHNSFLVFLPHIRELRHESDGPVVILGSGAGAANLPISQRRFQKFKRLWEAYKTQQQKTLYSSLIGSGRV